MLDSDWLANDLRCAIIFSETHGSVCVFEWERACVKEMCFSIITKKCIMHSNT